MFYSSVWFDFKSNTKAVLVLGENVLQFSMFFFLSQTAKLRPSTHLPTKAFIYMYDMKQS